MPFYPTVTPSSRSVERTEAFLGLDRRKRISDGAWSDMANLTTDDYPVLATRTRRGTEAVTLTNPQGMIAKTTLAVVDNGTLRYNGRAVDGFSLAATGEKTLVSMGAYLLIWPDKKYFNTEDESDKGEMEQKNSVTLSAGRAATLEICSMDGDGITVTYTQSSEPTGTPSSPIPNGAYWIDTSSATHVLKRWSAATSLWGQEATTYVKLTAPGIGSGLEQWDGVTISGLAAPDGSSAKLAEQVSALDGTVTVYGVGENHLILVGLIDEAVTMTTGTIKAERTVPDMDFVTEAENRIWGCKYGIDEHGQTVNVIYGCALGDFKNWNRYLGISTDSWFGYVGTDGQWTGAATLLGHPVFFKETCYHKLYISTGGAHQIVSGPCRGVQRGSEKSLQVVGEVLYYKGKTGVYRYDGSLPSCVSDALGDLTGGRGVAGVWGDKYYLALQEGSGADTETSLYVLDTRTGLWSREDGAEPLCFAATGSDLFYLEAGEAPRLRCVLGTGGTKEDPPDWRAVSGKLGLSDQNRKYLSRFNFRMELEAGAHADFYIQYDSDGIWHHQGHMEGDGQMRTFLLPVRPRRCDHLELKLEGRGGGMRLYSISREYQRGSDGQWGA